MPLNDAVLPDPLAKTKRQIRYYLQHIHELGQMWIAPTAMDDSGGGGGGSFESGAWWETLACMRCDIARAMQGLTERQKQAVWLLYLVGFAFDEVMELLDVNSRNLEKLLARAVQNMAESIGEEW